MKYRFVFIKSLIGTLLALSAISCHDSRHKSPATIAIIKYDYSGCFGGGMDRIVIYQVEKVMMAKLERDGKKLLANVKISGSQLDTFYRFLDQLEHLDPSGACTTVSHYNVQLDNKLIKRTDKSCHWHGFANLSACFFRKVLVPEAI